ncbi:MAG TPA: FliH/SctL family protein [Pirellulaceae bacterium]|nr:FliH/SctL family protein [Pirellulaceae bacterium]HMO92874.1 FliH/SctL family protein [Pirellulaceae bacterium]HMP71093.1 FliH/SctL family protein [Pirellulaceae bacterium]
MPETQTENNATYVADFEIKLRELLTQLDRQFRAMWQVQANTLHECRELAVKLGMEIARAVVRHEVGVSDKRIMELLEEAVAGQKDFGTATLYVNGKIIDRIKRTIAEANVSAFIGDVRADDSLAIGDCRIEAASCALIADHEEQMSRIQAKLLEYLQDAGT